MADIPREQALDSTRALARDPYGFIFKRCRQHRTDVFQTRILLRKTICMTGSAAAEVFYDETRFRRHGATPGRFQKTLFGQGGVQGLDDAPHSNAHRHRKQMLMELTNGEQVARLTGITLKWWETYARRWAFGGVGGVGEVGGLGGAVVLYDQLHELLTWAVCQWANVPLASSDVPLRTRQLTFLFDAAGDIGPRYWHARLARKRANHWAQSVIERIRAGRVGEMQPAEDSAACVIAHYQDLQGKLLPAHVAAVELLNVLRPTVAVSAYIVLAAAALHKHGQPQRARLANDAAYRQCFAQEVRRYYPFFPAVAAVVRQDFTWRGFEFHQGTRVMLDLYGTNHDPRVWDSPWTFRPDRFADHQSDPFGFIPQGGGDAATGHRCPGESLTDALIAQALEFLTNRMSYEVPTQDLHVSRRRLPALPRSGFVIQVVALSDGT